MFIIKYFKLSTPALLFTVSYYIGFGSVIVNARFFIASLQNFAIFIPVLIFIPYEEFYCANAVHESCNH